MRHPTPRPPTRGTTRRLSLLLVVAVAMSVVGVWGAPGASATSYRFWSYWTGGSDWTFSSQGAARRPADGTVDGWRFAVSPASSSTIPPRHSPSFSSLCGKTPAQDGKKRVGLVVDSGVSGDAPSGESPPAMIATCAVVPEDANGYDILMTVATLRTDRGLICGINGYPARECGEAVADPGPSDDGHDPGDGSSGNPGGGSGGTDTDGNAGDGGSSGSGGHKADERAGKGKDRKNEESKKDDKGDGDRSAEPSADVDEVAAAAATSTPAPPSSGSPVGLIVGLVVVVIIGATAFLVRRRRA